MRFLSALLSSISSKRIISYIVGSACGVAWLFAEPPATFAAQTANGERRLTFNIAGKPAEIWYFGNYSLDSAANSSVTRAVVMVHGAGRNAGGYYGYTLSAAQKAKREASTLVIAVHFPMERDLDSLAMGDSVLYWTNQGWKQGDESVESKKRPRKTTCAALSSFAVMDSVVMRLADKKRYPKLTAIVLAGHSAGGQFMQRYSAGSIIPSVVQAKRQIQFRFIVSNPSSYAYLDERRPVFALADSAGNVGTFLRPADTSGAGDFNEYRYGLEKLNPYMAATGVARIRRQFLEREVHYLMGGADTLQYQDNLDTSRSARLQGRFRLERGRAFHAYILQHAQNFLLTTPNASVSLPKPFKRSASSTVQKTPPHRLTIVPNVGHDGNKMYNSDAALRLLFE